MKEKKLTEAEIVDAMIQKADPELEKSLEQTLHKDLKTGAVYSKWGDLIIQIQKETPPLKKISANVAKGVMEQIRTQNITQTLPMDEPERLFGVLGGILRRPLAKILVPGFAAALLACLLFVGKAYRDTHSLFVEKISGSAITYENPDVPSGAKGLRPSTRLFFPVCLKTMDQSYVQLTLPGGNSVIIREETLVRISSGRSVWQKSGLGQYNITKLNKNDPFTVQIPQGEIVDLGTRFDVEVKEKGGSVLTVREGRVKVIPASGAEIVHATQDDCVLVSANRALKVETPSTQSLFPRASVRTKTPGKTEDSIRLSLNPKPVILSLESNLLGFISPLTIALSKVEASSMIRDTINPSAGLYRGTLKIMHNREKTEYAVGMGTDMNSRQLIFLDINRNGDPFDDLPFREGRDFVPGKTFLACNPENGPAVYLRHPIRIIRSDGKTTFATDPDRLEFLNLNSQRDTINIKLNPDQTESYTRDVLLLDSDSDGDFLDEDGSLVIWGREEKPGTMNIFSLAPWGKQLMDLGYIWNLSPEKTGAFRIEGSSVKKEGIFHKMEIGDPFPVMHVQAVNGENVSFDAPKGGFLLLYFWSTWYSACQVNVPFEFHDMNARFRNRGLKMVGISTDFRKEDLDRYIETQRINYPQVYSGPRLWEGITAKLGIDRIPSSILVDDAGTVVLVDQDAETIWSFLDRNLPEIQAKKGKNDL